MDSILLIEDDHFIAESLTLSLKTQGFDLKWVDSLKKARSLFKRGAFTAVLLDLSLPDGTGFDFCREVRELDTQVPILILTAKTDEESAIRGLQLGATDYIRKPFGVRELVARLKRYTQREVVVNKILTIGTLTLDLDNRKVTVGSDEVTLTPKEFDILELLAKNAGNLVSKEEVHRKIDGEGSMFDVTLASHISRLRQKLKKVSGDKIQIVSAYGQGYRLQQK